MSIDIAASLNERQRNALLSYYLGQYVPASNDQNLIDRVQTPEDVYEYLLIDPLVSNAVPTSRVAQAMSSIQQYINGITMNMEPGYSTENLDQDNINNWKGGLSQYDIWAGEVDLDTYPENYIDPTLRQNQTTYFKELITDLNQNTINNDTAQQSVLNYLNKFEQVANLDIISGYLDGNSPTTQKYYFLGKTRTSPVQYYWRSFDMSQNVDNVVSVNAWSEWYLMNIGLNEESLLGRPRLACFNNRLYIIWFEQSIVPNPTSSDGSGTTVINAMSSYCQFNNQWSAPYILETLTVNDPAYSELTNADPSELYTIAVHNIDDNEETLSCSIYTMDGSTPYDFSISVDYWFCNIQEKAKLLSVYYAAFSGVIGQNTIQFALENAVYSFQLSKSDTKDTFKLPMLPKVADLTTADCTLNESTGHLTVNSKFTVISENYTRTDLGTLEVTGDSQNRMTISGVILADMTARQLLFNGTMTSESSFTSGDDISKITLSNGSQSIHGTYSPIRMTGNSSPLTDIKFDINNFIWDPSTPCTLAFELSYTGVPSNSYTITTSSFSPKTTLQYKSWTASTYEDNWNMGEPKATTGPVSSLSNTQSLQSNLDISGSDNFFQGIIAIDSADGTYECYRGYILTVTNSAKINMPVITVRSDTTYGSVQYMDFTGITFSDAAPVSNIRLNTLFTKELINKASISISSLLAWETQFTQEPGMTDTSPTSMDFSGANGLYFWELFFYMPYLVAWRLTQEQQHSDALIWYCYIFDPSARGRTSSSTSIPAPPDYWSIRPLVEAPASGAQASAIWLTDDPDALACANPVHYRKSIFMAYISTLMAAADASYRLLTHDSLSLARLQYGQVRDLVGPRPDSMIVSHWVPDTLEYLANSDSAALTGYEQQVTTFPAFAGQASAADSATISDVFMAPVNTQLLSYWNTLDSRLYNLHHWLTIDGLPLSIPLYAPPVNPALLIEQSVQGGSLISTMSGIVVTVPPFRFTTLLQSARIAVSTLSQFGQTQLSYCERQDATDLQELDAQQLFNLSSYTLQLQQNAIDALDKDQTALKKSRDMAQQRYDHYQALYNQNISAGETAAMALQDASSAALTAASPFITAGMAMRTVPNIFGLADGGEDIGAPTIAAGMVMQLTGEIQGIAARQTEISEGYKRRREEWDILYRQAQSEIDVIDAQLDTLAVQRTGAVTALNLAKAQQANLKSTLNFLTTRFTQSALYNWLIGQLSALYYQAYDATLSLCLSAEASWQYEMGDITTRFIQTGTWNDNYRGLLVGETLQLNLQQMESAWLNRYTRRLEITRTVSLKSLLATADWNTLQSSGKTTFSLKESLFDSDYPGHYLRQIKSVTVSLPALVGPYQNVRMTLTQSGSRVLLKPDINGVNYLNDPTKGSAVNILTNPRASQQVAVSSGLNDAGLFVLNFGDERYLPFEGTGAVSDWQIAFPNPTSDEQKALLASLNDVIVQVHYTAIYGGSGFEQAVSATL